MFKFISLFSGVGGLDIGLHQAGFVPIFCSEIDENALLTLKGWYEKKGISPVFSQDINEVNISELRKSLNLQKGELDLLAGGPPCQSFSLIGARKSLNDDRGILLHKMIEFAAEFLPRTILIEQVKGLLSAKGNDGISGSVFKNLVQSLQDLNYSVYHQVLRASDYGVAQLRDRVFIIATLNSYYKDEEFHFPKSTHYQEKESSLFCGTNSYLTLNDVIRDLPKPNYKTDDIINVPNHIDITPKRDIERITGVPEGECLARQLHLPAEQRQRLNPEKDTTKFRRMSWDKPALTLRGGEVFYHPTENRYLTPREYMRIHGFPDEHILFGPIRARSGSVKNLDQHRMIANAVPPPLAKTIGKSIANTLLKLQHQF